MPVNFAVGGSEFLTKHPRVIFTQDGRSGCPPASTTDFYSTSVTTTATKTIFFTATSMIRYWASDASGSRCDLGVKINGPSGSGYSGGEDGRTLDYADRQNEWETSEHYTAFVGNVAGTYTITSFDATGGNCASRWGCGGNWGGQIVMVFE